MSTKRYKEVILKHLARYPHSEIVDLFKLINQAAFGTGHLLKSRGAALLRIEEEMPFVTGKSETGVEVIDEAVSRLHLSYLSSHGISKRTLAALFDITSRFDLGGEKKLVAYMDALAELIDEGKVAFSKSEFIEKRDAWKSGGYLAPSHSDKYRELYAPHYRVISNRLTPFLPLFSAIDKALDAKGNVLLAIEGGSASGKTTLSSLLADIYGASVFHTDDFYLPLEKQKGERLTTPGECTDHERFLYEVVMPLSRGEAVDYRRFDCSTQTLKPPERIEGGQLSVCEGSYSAHPTMEKYYDLIAFLDVDKEVQRNRIVARNTPYFANRHFTEWIPREEVYFRATSIKERADIVIPICDEETEIE